MAFITKKTTRLLIWIFSAVFGLSLAGYAAHKYGVPLDYNDFPPLPTATPSPTPSIASPTATPTPTSTPAPTQMSSSETSAK